MGQMANNERCVSGNFTVPDGISTYKISIGKTINNYVWYVEMSEVSKSALMATGSSANKAYAFLGKYPQPQIDNKSPSSTSFWAFRVNPSTQGINTLIGYVSGIDNTGITIGVAGIDGAANALVKGYTYNYYIYEIE